MDQKPLLGNINNTDYRSLIGDVFFTNIWLEFEKTIIDKDGKLLKKPTVNPINYKSYFDQEKEIWKVHDVKPHLKNFDSLQIKVEYQIEKQTVEDLRDTELIILSTDFENQLNAYHAEYESLHKSLLSSYKAFYEKIALESKYYSQTAKDVKEAEKFMGGMILKYVYNEICKVSSVEEFDAIFTGDTLEVIREYMEDEHYTIVSESYRYSSLRSDVANRIKFIERYIGLKAKYYHLRQLIAKRFNFAEPHNHPIDIIKRKIINHVQSMDLDEETRQLRKEFLFDLAEHDQNGNGASFRTWFNTSKYCEIIPERTAYEYNKILMKLK
jgi:hypothetical protein